MRTDPEFRALMDSVIDILEDEGLLDDELRVSRHFERSRTVPKTAQACRSESKERM